MIIHPDPDKARPIEQRVQGLICRQLMFKVDDSKIFINKEDFVDLLYLDVKALALANYDLDEALKIALKQQPHYSQARDTKIIELEETLEAHCVEIDAYVDYLECLDEGIDDNEIYERVLYILRTDEEAFHDKMEEILFYYFHQRQSLNVDDNTMQFLLFRLAKGVRLLATNGSLDEACEAAEYEDGQLQIDRNFLEQISALTNEISAYKLAISIYEQGSEIGFAIEVAKNGLGISSDN